MRIRGLRYRDVAPHCGLTPESLRHILCGRGHLSPRVRAALCAHFELPESDLFITDERASS
jgi:hypothetical protein